MKRARELTGKAALAGSKLLAVLSVFEILCMELTTVFHQFLYAHAHWLWIHTDDRSEVLVLIYTWMCAFAAFVLCLFADGLDRRRAFILSGSVLVGMPALLYVVVCVDGAIRFAH